MHKIRYLTGGESHGSALVGILEGLPAGLKIDIEAINFELSRRQKGYGRGGRMKIENDRAEIISGVRFGKTLGSPVSVLIHNRDWKNWQNMMQTDGQKNQNEIAAIRVPRPGHADLAGSLKYGHFDMRNVLERASARETAIRVALGAIAKQFIQVFGVRICSHVKRIAGAQSSFSLLKFTTSNKDQWEADIQEVQKRTEDSSVRCCDSQSETEMIQQIEQAKRQGETVGGEFELGAFFLPPGLGSHVHWDRKLDGRIAAAMMSIPAIKAVEIGLGKDAGELPGSQVHDEIFMNEQGRVVRRTNYAGGLEGGITNGEPLIIRCTMKPIPTLMKPLLSIDLDSKQKVSAHKERSDTCAVPAAAVVGEAILALVLADAFSEKFGGDSIDEMAKNYQNYLDAIERAIN